MSADPEFITRELQDGDILVSASDGLWDVCTNERVAEIVSAQSNIRDVPKALAREAAAKSKELKVMLDNTTIVAVEFRLVDNISLPVQLSECDSSSTITEPTSEEGDHTPVIESCGSDLEHAATLQRIATAPLLANGTV